jgi:hypothetical protein
MSSVEDVIEQLAADGSQEEGGQTTTSRRPSRLPQEVEAAIQVWEDDPFLKAVDGADPEPAQPIPAELPENDHDLLQTRIAEQQPDPGIDDPSTADFRYWNAAAALARGINFWAPLLPDRTRWSSDEQPLQVELDAGVDLNAFYARESGLNFFHDTVEGSTVFSGGSPHVVCHELGHAILDAVKPELFDAMSLEVAAFHEAFGDISSMLSALQLPQLREIVLDQTGGKLNTNSRLSQMARQLGWAIRAKFGPDAADSDSLRNTANRFFYQDPASLPPSAPSGQLSSEPHSFSRVFSGAFLDVLAGMYHIGPAGSSASDSDQLETVTQDAGRLLIEGVRLASVGSGYYAQVAAGMIQADQTISGGRYRTALTSSFLQRGILSPTATVFLSQELQKHGGQAFGVTGRAARTGQLQFEEDNEGYKKTARDAPALPVRPITTRFGITLHVHLPAEPNRFGVYSASLAGGSQETRSPEEDARSFIEDLIQLDRISHEGAAGVLPAELTSPGKDTPCEKTHRLIREDGKTVLKRRHFDCGFCGGKHRR